MPSEDANAKQEEKFALTTSRQFAGWLDAMNASLVFSIYQAGKLFLIGINADDKLSIFERTIERPMALCEKGDELYLSSLYQLWKFRDVTGGAQYEG